MITFLKRDKAIRVGEVLNAGVSGGANEGLNEGINKGLNGGVNEGINDLYNFISEHPGFRAINFFANFNNSYSTIERYIRMLKKENKIEYRGSKKTGGYFIK